MSGETIFWSIVSIVIGVLGNRYFATRSQISWEFRRRKVLDPIGLRYPSDVKISLDGEIIDNLIEWRIAIWNSGNRPIINSSFIDKNDIYIEIPDGRVLKIEPPKLSRDILKCSIEKTDGGLKFSDINIIDKDDFMLLTFYSTMDNVDQNFNRQNWPKISCDIVGMPLGPKLASRRIASGRKGWISLIGVVAYLWGMASMIGIPAVLKIWFPEKLQPYTNLLGGYTEVPALMSYLLIFFGTTMFLLGVVIFSMAIYSAMQRVPRAVAEAMYPDRSFIVLFRQYLRKIG